MNFLETICISDNVVQNIECHKARMRCNSGVELPDLTVLNNLKGRVKCRVVYNVNEIISIEFMSYKLPIIKSLKVVESPTIIYDKKFEDRNDLSVLYGARGECDDIIICRNGDVGDSYFCNLVFMLDGQLFTPDTSLLHGTKRQTLIDRGVITPCKITRDDISRYDGVYLINAMIDISDKIYIPTSGINIF